MKEDMKRAQDSAGCAKRRLQAMKKDDYDYLANSASGMDCTGLMNRTALNEDEMESYQQVYQYLPPNMKAVSGDEEKDI